MKNDQTDDADASLTGGLDASIAVSVKVRTPKLPTEVTLVLVAIGVQSHLMILPVFV